MMAWGHHGTMAVVTLIHEPCFDWHDEIAGIDDEGGRLGATHGDAFLKLG